MSRIHKFTVSAFGFALVMGAQTAVAEGIGTGLQQQTSGVTTSSIYVDMPSRVQPMEGIGTGSSQNSGATTSSYHFRSFGGVRPMEGIGTGNMRVLASSCAAPASFWTAFACSLFQ
jgi:hypothetical protein